jgi:hypothetical protein
LARKPQAVCVRDPNTTFLTAVLNLPSGIENIINCDIIELEWRMSIMLGTLIFLIVAAIIITLLYAITDIIKYWWAYLLLALISAALVIYDTKKRKK